MPTKWDLIDKNIASRNNSITPTRGSQSYEKCSQVREVSDNELIERGLQTTQSVGLMSVKIPASNRPKTADMQLGIFWMDIGLIGLNSKKAISIGSASTKTRLKCRETRQSNR